MERWRRKVEWPREYPDMTVTLRVRMAGRREVLRGVLCCVTLALHNDPVSICGNTSRWSTPRQILSSPPSLSLPLLSPPFLLSPLQ